MAAKETLDSSIQQCPQSLETRYQIIQGFWDSNISLSGFENGHLQCDKYFSYYAEECRLALHDGGRHILTRTHRDVVELATHLKHSTMRTDLREILRKKLPLPHPDDAENVIDNTIDLLVRLFLMVRVGSFNYVVSDSTQLSWRGDTLQDFVQQRFSPAQVLKGAPIKLEKIFNARNLQRIAGIQISWTDNLADHLSIRDDDTRVAIFHHASFLMYQKERYAIIRVMETFSPKNN
jgi:hypothetical protein